VHIGKHSGVPVSLVRGEVRAPGKRCYREVGKPRQLTGCCHTAAPSLTHGLDDRHGDVTHRPDTRF